MTIEEKLEKIGSPIINPDLPTGVDNIDFDKAAARAEIIHEDFHAAVKKQLKIT